MRKIKLPSTVYPAGIPFKVVEDKLDEDEHGEMIGEMRTIRISSEKSHQSTKWDTLLHEYLHAILYVSGLSQVLDEKMEEGIVITMECHLKHLIDLEKIGERA